MKFSKILEIVRNNIDETDADAQIDIIIKSAVNEAYKTLCTVDKRIQVGYIDIIDGIAMLPDDYISMVSIEPELSEDDTIIGNSIVTNKQGEFKLTYVYSRPDLVKDNDEPELNEALIPALWNYAAYKYWLHRKKYQLAEYVKNAYMTIVSNYISNANSLPEFVTDVRSDYYR